VTEGLNDADLDRQCFKDLDGNIIETSDLGETIVSAFGQDGFDVAESDLHPRERNMHGLPKSSNLRVVSDAIRREYEELQQQYSALSQFTSNSPDSALDHSIPDRMQDLIDQVQSLSNVIEHRVPHANNNKLYSNFLCTFPIDRFQKIPTSPS
jgi:hypothetical protein